MSSEIQKYNLTPEVKNQLEKHAPDLKVGDTFIKIGSYECLIYRIKGFTENKYGVRVIYDQAINWEATEWKEKEKGIDEFKEYYLKCPKIPEGTTPQQWYEEAKKLISGEINISDYEDQDTDSVNSNTAIMSKNSKQALIAVQDQLELKRQRADLIRTFVSYEMEKRKQELEKVRESLNGVLAVFEKKISKIMKVIQTIELYLGIDEELFQIQDGEKASADDPICWRQMILFMDEEIGYWKNGEGLDFEDISWFDEWLVRDNNYKKLIPESKGMVVFRPRRYDREYKGYDTATKALMNKQNRVTYLLIRNGECLYRVYTENIKITGRLFPRRSELEELLKNLEGEVTDGSFYRNSDSVKEQAENTLYQYKKRAILMQGLLDRTDIFNPISRKISIFKLDEAEGLIRFIYDDELALPSGRLPFKEWKEQINSKIEHGSRVICTGYGSSKDNHDRFLKYYSNDFSIPYTPSMDLYEVEKYMREDYDWLDQKEYDKLIASNKPYKLIEHNPKRWSYSKESGKSNDGYRVRYNKELLTIMYHAGGEVWGGWGKGVNERKNKTRFIIEKYDSCILNYDQISLEDIDFYLTSRVDRPNYLSMMPVLETLKERRLKELESEKAFARLIWDRNVESVPEGIDQSEWIKTELWDRIFKSIDWWKFKNQWKRPIQKDDELALRMIEKRINSKNYHNLK